MAQVQTLGGPIDTGQLGTVLMHEHIFNLTPEIQGCFPGFHGWDPDVEIPKAQQELSELKEAGYDTILELSVVGLGRDVNLMAQAVDGTGLQVIVSTGLYTYDVLPRLFHFVGPGALLEMPEPLDDLFARDIEEGIQGTDIKAGCLKCAVDHDGLTPHVERVLRACCRVHHRTNAPMTVHTHSPSERGKDVLKILSEEGVDPKRVVLAHCGDSADLDYLQGLAETGVTLGMDRFGLDILLPFEDRVNTVVALCEKGLAGQMILSHDANCFSDWFPPGMSAEVSPNWHFLHIHNDVLPALRERGVTDDQIDQMLRATPKDFFERA